MAALKEAGACGFTDDGIPLKNAAFLYQAMEAAKKLDVPISLHEEDPAFIKNNGIIMEQFLNSWASMVLPPLRKNLWLREIVCLPCVPVHTL